MKDFARLYEALDASLSTQDKVAALRTYLAQAEPADAAWAVYFLAGGKPRQVVRTAVLRQLAAQAAGLPDWLFEACYQTAGDLAETIALVWPRRPGPPAEPLGLARWMNERLLPLRSATPEEAAERLRAWMDGLDTRGRFLLVKLVGGGFRVGVSRLLVQRALAEHAGLAPAVVAQRMMGYTHARARPDAAALSALLTHDTTANADPGRPYPFFLAHALDDAFVLPQATADWASVLGPPAAWQAEWKFDGIRAQLVRRAGRVFIWSRGEELVGESFPELLSLAEAWPDGLVLDGEILAWNAQAACVAPFSQLQRRLGRLRVGRQLLEQAPVTFMAYDALEADHRDLRHEPQWRRRDVLEQLAAQCPGLRLSPLLSAPDWPALALLRDSARARGAEGLMLKQRQAPYGVGRSRADGLWCKWKLEPWSVDAVLIYAQAGHGRRAGVYTDYTFAVWSRAPHNAQEAQAVVQAIAERRVPEPGALQLVAFAKAYSGLSDAEFRTVDAVIRRTTLEKFGPVRSVRPTLVFELGFEGLQRSTRHKSGVAVRFARMLRQRPDKPLHEAACLADLMALLGPPA